MMMTTRALPVQVVVEALVAAKRVAVGLVSDDVVRRNAEIDIFDHSSKPASAFPVEPIAKGSKEPTTSTYIHTTRHLHH